MIRYDLYLEGGERVGETDRLRPISKGKKIISKNGSYFKVIRATHKRIARDLHDGSFAIAVVLKIK